jgi:hypothetical protein
MGLKELLQACGGWFIAASTRRAKREEYFEAPDVWEIFRVLAGAPPT